MLSLGAQESSSICYSPEVLFDCIFVLSSSGQEGAQEIMQTTFASGRNWEPQVRL